MTTNVLVIGSGGREHALAWKLSQSKRIGSLYVAPGNGGTRHIAKNVPIATMSILALSDFAASNNIGLTVVGPDDPLAAGIVDVFRARGLRIFGPTHEAASLESSKAFAKRLMEKSNIPTAPFMVFSDHGRAFDYVHRHGVPIVIKASGLALGKGAYVCSTMDQAEEALTKIMVDRVHGTAGNLVVVEDFLEGPEVSVHAFCDSTTALMFPPSQDHKAELNGDKGDNTGGMGTVAPLTRVTADTLATIHDTIVQPTLAAMTERGHPFTGLLYPGLKMTPSGPMVLEYNARFGDPETQCYMRLLDTDLLDIFDACVDNQLAGGKIEWYPGHAACITLASRGYPRAYPKGFPIFGIEDAERVPGVQVFHAGTVFDGVLRTNGGRVLSVTAVGTTLREALDRAYEGAALIRFEGMHYRTDIGAKAL